MWSNIPFDLLANIFSFLSPDSLARAMSTCRNWHTFAEYTASPETSRRHHPAWFVALPARSRSLSCYVHNPIEDNWHLLSLSFVPNLARPIATLGGLIVFRHTSATVLQLAICNPFTSQLKQLPKLQNARTNPAVGVVEYGPFFSFRIYVAGGMSEAPRGGASYETTVEMYDSRSDAWKIIGSMPVEFAVRLTVWTPNESVCANGVLYWMTSARAYSIMGFEIGTNKWRELGVPMGDRLEFAALVPRNKKLTLVGGTSGGEAFIWELSEGHNWCVIEKVPCELATLLGGKGSWGSTKCVGIDGAVCLYRDLGTGMVVWREVVEKGRWEWFWVKGCCSMRGKEVENFPIKGLLLHPNLAPSFLLSV
ncbi:hypothetical protein RJ640_021233 [Escallonia rubra]|uniref:F-box domain-containing protein n=1 Tax=Escallonia rubra TaxID=112253 RepID=A0AA88QR21_9ASTE|nr:hypothetical protein RJ640_021233 [Escallonia rubra]